MDQLGFGPARLPPGYGAQPRGEFVEVEGLGEVVVGPASRPATLSYASGEGRLVNWPVEAEVIGVILGP